MRTHRLFVAGFLAVALVLAALISPVFQPASVTTITMVVAPTATVAAAASPARPTAAAALVVPTATPWRDPTPSLELRVLMTLEARTRPRAGPTIEAIGSAP